MKELSCEEKELIEEKVFPQRFSTIMHARYLTNHKDDKYLKVIFSINHVKKEYAVHLYNSDTESLTEGYYTKNVENANRKYENKK